MNGPADLEMTSDGEFVIGNIDGKPDPRLEPLRHMLSQIVPTRISLNIMGELYSKLVINSCINSLGAITGLELGRLLASQRIRNIFMELMREAMAVADALNIRVEPGGGGKLGLLPVPRRSSLMSSLKRHAMVRIIGFKYRRIKSSSLQSLERGRATEIDYLNGYISDHGKKHGVPTPVNDAVISMVKQIEAHTRSISAQNLDDPAFTSF
jgi:2-dehydropantoate 2-reductase